MNKIEVELDMINISLQALVSLKALEITTRGGNLSQDGREKIDVATDQVLNKWNTDLSNSTNIHFQALKEHFPK